MGESKDEYEDRYNDLKDKAAGETVEEEEEKKEGGHWEYEGGEGLGEETVKDEAAAEDELNAAEAEYAQAMDAVNAVSDWRSRLPPWLLSKPGEISAFDSLTKIDYRSGTWMCFLLSFFNVMSGITVLLVYMGNIFDDGIDNYKQIYKLTDKQMSSGLTTSVVFGAGLSMKMVEKLTRRQVFCIGHALMGIFLAFAGYFY